MSCGVIEILDYAESVPPRNSIGEKGKAQYRKLGILRQANIEGKKPIRAFVDRVGMKNSGRKTGVGHSAASDSFGTNGPLPGVPWYPRWILEVTQSVGECDEEVAIEVPCLLLLDIRVRHRLAHILVLIQQAEYLRRNLRPARRATRGEPSSSQDKTEMDE